LRRLVLPQLPGSFFAVEPQSNPSFEFSVSEALLLEEDESQPGPVKWPF